MTPDEQQNVKKEIGNSDYLRQLADTYSFQTAIPEIAYHKNRLLGAADELDRLRALNAQLLEALKKAEMALRDLGACDDPNCDVPNCVRALPSVCAAIDLAEKDGK